MINRAFTEKERACSGTFLMTSLNEFQPQSNLHCGHRGFVPLLCAMEPVSPAVRFHARLQSDSAFSAMSCGSAPSLIPLIGGCPPGSPGCWGVLQSLAFTPSRYSFMKVLPDTVPNRPQRRTGRPSWRSSAECVNSSAHGQPTC